MRKIRRIGVSARLFTRPFGRRLDRRLRLPSPGQPLVDRVDGVIGDAGEDVGELGFGGVAIEGGGSGDGHGVGEDRTAGLATG
jgi:hypothetical protein